jgi:hypothetical protein
VTQEDKLEIEVSPSWESAEVVVEDRLEGFQIGSPVEITGVGIPESVRGRWFISETGNTGIGLGFQERIGARLSLRRFLPGDDESLKIQAVEQHLAEKYLADGRRATFCGFPVEKLSRDGLVGVIGGLMRERERLQDLHVETMKIMTDLGRGGR